MNAWLMLSLPGTTCAGGGRRWDDSTERAGDSAGAATCGCCWQCDLQDCGGLMGPLLCSRQILRCGAHLDMLGNTISLTQALPTCIPCE